MSERVRFQADANFSAVIVKGMLRRQPLVDYARLLIDYLHHARRAERTEP